MRLSLPHWGRSPEKLTITQAEAIAFRVPMDLAAENAQRSVAPFNYLVSVRGETSHGVSYFGLGEAQPRPNQTGDLHDRSWPFLDDALAGLVGQSLSLRHPLDDIRGHTRLLEDAADKDEFNPLFRSRATIMGIETALLDLAAKAKGVTFVDLLGRRRLVTAPVPPVMRHRDPSKIDEYFQKRVRGAKTPLRLVGGEDITEDLEHFQLVATARRAIRPSAAAQPIWFNFRGKLAFDSARHIVEEVAHLAAGGKLPSQIVLQNLLARHDLERSAELQSVADSLAQRVAGSSGVTILPRSAGPSDTADMLGSEEGTLRMLNIRPAELGGILRSIEIAENFKKISPEGQIVVSQFPGASRVTQMVHRDLAKALPNARFVGASAEVERKFRGTRRLSRLRRSPLLRQGTGLALDYQALVSQARGRILHPSIPSDATPGLEPNTYDDVDYISPIGAYAVHGHIVEREALARGLNSWRFTKSSIMVSDTAGVQLPFRTTRWPLSGVLASSVAKHKESTRILLRRAGCPVPEGRTFHGGDHEISLSYARRIGYPVVLKPAEGSMGVGVTANIGSDSELTEALRMFSRTAHGNDEFIVEKHINGGDYRIMVIGDEVAAAVQRIPANVVGDGVQTVGQLMIEKNVARRQNSHLGPLKIKWDASVAYQLGKQGYTIDSVIPAGQRIYLLSTNNLTQGGESVEILDELHPSIKEASVRAVKAVPGMGYCGVDFLLEDHTKPLDEQDGAICEINAMAALPVAEYPVYGTPRRLSEQFILRCVEAFGLESWPERAETLNLRLTIHGGVTGVGYGKWFTRRASKSGLSGWFRNTGERQAEALVSGPTAAATAMATVAILGPPKAAPESVKSVHTSELPELDEFVLFDEDSDDRGGVAFEPGANTDLSDFEESDSSVEETSTEPEQLSDLQEIDDLLSPEELEDRLEEQNDGK